MRDLHDTIEMPPVDHEEIQRAIQAGRELRRAFMAEMFGRLFGMVRRFGSARRVNGGAQPV